MTTYDNAPPQPDWAPPIGVLCGGCGSTENLCRVLGITIPRELCCDSCTHQVAVEINVDVPYYGD